MTLYQQGVQRIEVIVRKDGGSGGEDIESTGTGEKDGDEVGGGATWRSKLFGTEDPKRLKKIAKVNITHTVAVAKQVTDLGIEYAIGWIGMQYGDQAYKDRVNRVMEVAKDVTGFASSVAMGATYGMAGGPVGAAIGAVLGAVQGMASIGFKYENRARDYGYKVFKENNSIEYNRARASINLTTGRLR